VFRDGADSQVRAIEEALSFLTKTFPFVAFTLLSMAAAKSANSERKTIPNG
jgi:hypothetical protein